jgi:hypothetical protein
MLFQPDHIRWLFIGPMDRNFAAISRGDFIWLEERHLTMEMSCFHKHYYDRAVSCGKVTANCVDRCFDSIMVEAGSTRADCSGVTILPPAHIE